MEADATHRSQPVQSQSDHCAARADAPLLQAAYVAPPATATTLGLVGHALTDAHTPCLHIDTQLRALGTATSAWQESWFSSSSQHARQTVQRGQCGDVRYACTTTHLLACIEVSEQAHGDLRKAAAHAYQQLQACNAALGFAHLLRIWNYMDDINAGDDDDERYKQFCLGRADSYQPATAYPAASAIGRKQHTGTLQVYWLATHAAGRAIENPRQVSAYHYPRQYGPVSPGFARACLSQQGMLLISGTASIVGHASVHIDDLRAQLHETINNLEVLIQQAREYAPQLSPQLDASTMLKMYVRHAEHAPLLQNELRQRCGEAPRLLMLHADICRRELLLEMDCIHGLPATC